MKSTGKLKLPAKIVLAALVVGLLYGGVKTGERFGLIPQVGFLASKEVAKVTLPNVKDAQVANVKPLEFPLKGEADVSSTLIRGSIWEWNSQLGMILANGGGRTSKGSIMAKRGVNLQLTRQDDTVKMGEELIACAKEISEGAQQCSTGANFVIIMGDGAGSFIAGINPHLEKLGPEYKLTVIGSTGYSRGEDQFMASPEVKRNPQNAKGIVVATVPKDGDWNIVAKWAGDNGIKLNPDLTTWDPEAINIYASADYNAAAADFVANKCEERAVVKDGRKSTEMKKVCINAVSTWTPGDVTAAEQRGGVVRIVSSKEYRSQMPSAIVGSKKFFVQNRDLTAQMLAGIFEGGDQVKAYDTAMRKAAHLSAELYADQDGDYWYKYAKGVVFTDAQGNKVDLGGSAVNNLADNLILFGLVPGSNDNFASTYTTFAKIVTDLYPADFEATPIPPVKEVVDKSFITAAQAVMDDVGAEADLPKFNTSMARGSVVSARDYHITFEVGKATLTPEGKAELMALKDQIAITGLFVKLQGHTDNSGNEELTNIPLSKARAEAVKAFLQAKAPANFPENRFEVKGFGSSDPVASNATALGRAENRRVKLLLVGEE